MASGMPGWSLRLRSDVVDLGLSPSHVRIPLVHAPFTLELFKYSNPALSRPGLQPPADASPMGERSLMHRWVAPT